MGSVDRQDTWRRWATVFGAVLQVVAGALVPVGAIAGETPSLVIPADYAFAIWGVIFALGLACAVYQMLPSRRADPELWRAERAAIVVGLTDGHGIDVEVEFLSSDIRSYNAWITKLMSPSLNAQLLSFRIERESELPRNRRRGGHRTMQR